MCPRQCVCGGGFVFVCVFRGGQGTLSWRFGVVRVMLYSLYQGRVSPSSPSFLLVCAVWKGEGVVYLCFPHD